MLVEYPMYPRYTHLCLEYLLRRPVCFFNPGQEQRYQIEYIGRGRLSGGRSLGVVCDNLRFCAGCFLETYRMHKLTSLQTRKPGGGEGFTYKTSGVHAWSLFGSIQGLHPTYPGIEQYPRQHYTAVPSQDRGPNIVCQWDSPFEPPFGNGGVTG